MYRYIGRWGIRQEYCRWGHIDKKRVDGERGRARENWEREGDGESEGERGRGRRR